MLNVKNVAKSVLLSLMTLFILSSSLHAENKKYPGKNLVVFVSGSDVKQVGMGTTIAMAASAQAGANVTIIIGAGAVNYILKGGKNSYFKPMNEPIQDVLKTAIKSGANVYLCGMCAKALNVKESDLVKGAKIVESTTIFAKVFANDTQIISF